MLTNQKELNQQIQLATQGNPQALTALMSSQLEPYGVKVKIKTQDSCLYILLESKQIPNEGPIIGLLRKLISQIKSSTLELVKIYGKKIGDEFPAWSQEIKIQSAQKSSFLSKWIHQSLTSNYLDAVPFETPIITTGKKFLRFRLNGEDNALLPVEGIKEVVKLNQDQICWVPELSDNILGIYNWRGEMLWLVDLNQMVGFGKILEQMEHNVMAIAIQVQHKFLGLVVEQVQDIELHDVDQKQVSLRGKLLPPKLLRFVSGYLPDTNSMILNPDTITKAVSHIS